MCIYIYIYEPKLHKYFCIYCIKLAKLSKYRVYYRPIFDNFKDIPIILITLTYTCSTMKIHS